MSHSEAAQPTSFAARIADDELPESGRVDRFAKSLQSEGDHGMALRLQEEEFLHHYQHNREERWVMRENLREAKVVQSEEEERLQIERMTELERLQEMARKDEELARQLQEEEQGSTPDDRQLQADELLAVRIEEYEKARMKRYRAHRRRQLEQEDLDRAMATVDLSPNGVQVPPETPAPAEEEHFETDFTDFLSQLPSDLSADEIKVIQELEDAQLAKLLQEAESKRSGARTAAERINFIRHRAVELRDEQLARFVQQREISRYNERRARSTGTSGQSSPPNEATENGNNYVEHSPPRPSNGGVTYATVRTQPDNDTYMNLAVTDQQQTQPIRSRQSRAAQLDASFTRAIAASQHQRSDSYMGAVARVQTDDTAVSNGQDEYLTPNSLLEEPPKKSSSTNVHQNLEMEYETSQEVNHVKIDHSAIEASRRRRHRQQQHQRRSAENTLAPALPVVSPGAPPTAAPPPRRVTTLPRNGSNSPKSSTRRGGGGTSTGSAPLVTNPMYIIERPSKSKNKNSECKQQ